MAQKPVDLLLTPARETTSAHLAARQEQDAHRAAAPQRASARKTLADRRRENVARALSQASRKVPLFLPS